MMFWKPVQQGRKSESVGKKIRSIAAFGAASVLLLQGTTSCIERAPTPASRRAAFDRSGLRGGVILQDVPKSAVTVGSIFGESVELSGYEFFPKHPKPGSAVTVTFYWRVIRPPEHKYRIFIHAENTSGEGRMGADHWPAHGRYGTDMWQEGDIVRDDFKIAIPGSFDGDGIAVWAGFYFPKKSDVRMPVSKAAPLRTDGKNRLLAIRIPVDR